MTEPARIADTDREFHAALGHVIGVVRTSLVIASADLARRAHISEESLAAIERGEAEPSEDVLRSLADALGLSPNGLMESAYRHLAKKQSAPPADIPLVTRQLDPPAPLQLAGDDQGGIPPRASVGTPDEDPTDDIPVVTAAAEPTPDGTPAETAPDAETAGTAETEAADTPILEVEPEPTPAQDAAPSAQTTEPEADDPTDDIPVLEIPAGATSHQAADRPASTEPEAEEDDPSFDIPVVEVESRRHPDRSGPAPDLFGTLMADLADDLDDADRRLVLDLVLRLTAH